MKDHLFEQPGRSVTLEAHLESEPRIAEKPPACLVCAKAINLEAIKHSIRSTPLRPQEGEPPLFLLSCSVPCFNEECPVYLKLEVQISQEEFDKWRTNPNCRLDHTYFRDNRPITLEARANETLTAPPPHRCPVCLASVNLATVAPLSKILVSGMPLPRPNEPPQHKATAYAPCPHCGALLNIHCFISADEIVALRTAP